MVRFDKSYKWLVTGGAGFIGSHICNKLTSIGQTVIAIDNLNATGNLTNLNESLARENFRFAYVDTNFELRIVNKIDFILHQAAIGSVPRSIEYPADYFYNNGMSLMRVLEFARSCKTVKKVVYASSSSIYGSSPEEIKTELPARFTPLSPYAHSKQVNELQAEMYKQVFGVDSVGLRYFNVFGPRQNPTSKYSAVIPLWINEILSDRGVTINGDGSQSRDFNYVDNIVDYNIMSALQTTPPILNVCSGKTTSLLELFDLIRQTISFKTKKLRSVEINYGPEREGDIKFSCGSTELLDATFPGHQRIDLKEGISRTVDSFLEKKNAI